MAKMHIEFDLNDDLDLLPTAGFERVWRGQRRFDDNAGRYSMSRKKTGNHKVRLDKRDFDK